VEFLITEGEGTNVENGVVKWFAIGVAEKRAYWLRLVAHGTTAHGSIPRADNPVPRLARAVARAAAWQTPIHLLPAVDHFFKAEATLETGEHRAWLANAKAALATPRGRAYILGDPYRNAILRNTIAPTVLTGSTQTNIIPPVASAQLDIRLMPDQDTAAFKQQLARVIADTSVHIETMRWRRRFTKCSLAFPSPHRSRRARRTVRRTATRAFRRTDSTPTSPKTKRPSEECTASMSGCRLPTSSSV